MAFAPCDPHGPQQWRERGHDSCCFSAIRTGLIWAAVTIAFRNSLILCSYVDCILAAASAEFVWMNKMPRALVRNASAVR